VSITRDTPLPAPVDAGPYPAMATPPTGPRRGVCAAPTLTATGGVAIARERRPGRAVRDLAPSTTPGSGDPSARCSDSRQWRRLSGRNLNKPWLVPPWWCDSAASEERLDHHRSVADPTDDIPLLEWAHKYDAYERHPLTAVTCPNPVPPSRARTRHWSDLSLNYCVSLYATTALDGRLRAQMVPTMCQRHPGHLALVVTPSALEVPQALTLKTLTSFSGL
jgi:hypothetical protein